MSNLEQVILVDENDQEIGLMEKMRAHEEGLLHRAFSVFLFNDANELLLQKRASSKYHSGDLWTNTCCSHPRQGESLVAAGERRLKEEMGIQTQIHPQFHFIYKASLDNALTEHELDHVLFGTFNKAPQINPDEVSDWKYLSMDAIREDLIVNPQTYTAWFHIVFDEVFNRIHANENT